MNRKKTSSPGQTNQGSVPETIAQASLLNTEDCKKLPWQIIDGNVDIFLVYKITRDSGGIPMDFKVVEMSTSAARAVSLEGGQAAGKHSLLKSKGSWLKVLADTIRTGRSKTLQGWQPVHNEMRFLHVYCFSASPDRVAVIVADQTEQEHAYQKLLSSEKRYGLIANHLHDVIWQMNMDFRIVYATPSVERIFGYSVDEICQLGANDLLDEAGIKRMKKVIKKKLDSRHKTAILPTEYKMKRKDGHWVDVEGLSAIIHDENGKPAGWVGVIRDITERKLVQTNLLRANERLSLAQRSAGAGVWDWDISSGQLTWSPELFQLFGLGRDNEEAAFDTWRGIIHPDDRKMAESNIERAITTHTPLFNEYRIVYPSGEIRWIDALGNTTYDKDNNAIRMAGICIDVTDRKRIEEALQRSEADLAEAQRLAELGNWRVDMATGVARWSDELYRIFDIERTESANGMYQSFLSRVHRDDRQLVADVNRQARADGKPFEVEYRIQTRSGQLKYIREVGYVNKDAAGKVAGLFGVVQDITERKQADDALRKSEARLQESNQLMAGILAHTHMLVAYLDTHFNFIWVNRAYAKACKQEFSFFPGKNHFDLYPSEENQAVFQHVVDSGEPVFVAAKPFTFLDQPKRGVTYWDWSLIPVKDTNGNVSGLVFTLAEVTDRIQGEKALQKDNERLQAYVMKIESLQRQLREQAIRDPLTDLFNRRYLEETLDREIAQAKRSSQMVGLIIMDIDHFKKVNDAYGHRAGDKILKALGDLLKLVSRAGDIPCRYGGEEFVVVMPGANLKIAQERAERIRARFEVMHVPFGGAEIHATISLGVAEYPTHGNTGEAVLVRADRALYWAKQAGRNCVVPYQGTAKMSLSND